MSISSYIAKKLIDYDSEKSYAFQLRRKRAERIRLLINSCYEKHQKVSIIDIGGTKTYWNILPKSYLSEKNVRITVVNLPSGELLPENDEIFSFAQGDGCYLTAFSEKSFHIAHSNSVIEHVGSWENMQLFSKEIKRVAEQYYLQTPNYWFPVEPHFMTPFFHWFPKSFRAKLLMLFKLGWYPKANSLKNAIGMVETCNLLSRKDLKKLFPNADFYTEKIGFLNKSFVLIDQK